MKNNISSSILVCKLLLIVLCALDHFLEQLILLGNRIFGIKRHRPTLQDHLCASEIEHVQQAREYKIK